MIWLCKTKILCKSKVVSYGYKQFEKFKSERHNVFAEEINKIALSSNGYKRIQSIDSIETYAHGTRKDILNENRDLLSVV